MNDIHQRAAIRFAVLQKKAPKAIHEELVATLGEESPSHSSIKKWAAWFKASRWSTKDDQKRTLPAVGRAARPSGDQDSNLPTRTNEDWKTDMLTTRPPKPQMALNRTFRETQFLLIHFDVMYSILMPAEVIKYEKAKCHISSEMCHYLSSYYG